MLSGTQQTQHITSSKKANSWETLDSHSAWELTSLQPTECDKEGQSSILTAHTRETLAHVAVDSGQPQWLTAAPGCQATRKQRPLTFIRKEMNS